MRSSLPELRAARSLHRWLRRTALAAVPILGLTACGDNCEVTHNYSSTVVLSPSVGWAAGSVHSGSDCTPNCQQGFVCWSYEWNSCTVSQSGTSLTCLGTQTFCGTHPCGRLPAGLLSAGETDG